MFKVSTEVNTSVENIWNELEFQYRQAFELDENVKLKGAKTTRYTMSFIGKTVEIEQEITEVVEKEKIVLRSVSTKDEVHTIYKIETKDNKSILSLIEYGEGNNNKLRTWNFILMSLPILRGKNKKMLKQKLNILKNIIEEKYRGDSSVSS